MCKLVLIGDFESKDLVVVLGCEGDGCGLGLWGGSETIIDDVAVLRGTSSLGEAHSLACGESLAFDATHELEGFESLFLVGSRSFVGDDAVLVGVGDLYIYLEVSFATSLEVGGFLSKDDSGEALDELVGVLGGFFASSLAESLGPPVVGARAI